MKLNINKETVIDILGVAVLAIFLYSIIMNQPCECNCNFDNAVTLQETTK